MPLYYFSCSTCKGTVMYRLKAGEQKAPRPCSVCKKVMSRDPRPPSSQVMESIDTGMQFRRVERLADAERLYAERADNDPRNKPL
jgi:hypothetical protein